jgi:hypothetical protein
MVDGIIDRLGPGISLHVTNRIETFSDRFSSWRRRHR